ncbi:MAG: helix-turn-helix transcriptional regulator [Eubacteriales bacterium]
MTIGEKIRLFRELRGMTQVQLATITNINVGTIRKYELGIRNPKPEQLIKIADGLGKNVSTFYDLNICTAGDIMTLLIAVSEKAEVTFVGEKDEFGKFISTEVAMKFTDPYMQDLMSGWAFMKQEINEHLNQIELETDDVKKAEEMRKLSVTYNSYMRVLTDFGRVGTAEEPYDEVPCSKGLKDCMPFDITQNFEMNFSIVDSEEEKDDSEE